jgi:hypothetical protein
MLKNEDYHLPRFTVHFMIFLLLANISPEKIVLLEETLENKKEENDNEIKIFCSQLTRFFLLSLCLYFKSLSSPEL